MKEYKFPISDSEWAAMTREEREAASAAWFEQQEARDAAGQLRAIKGETSDSDRDLLGDDPDDW